MFGRRVIEWKSEEIIKKGQGMNEKLSESEKACSSLRNCIQAVSFTQLFPVNDAPDSG